MSIQEPVSVGYRNKYGDYDEDGFMFVDADEDMCKHHQAGCEEFKMLLRKLCMA